LLLLLPFFTRAAAVHSLIENSANCSCCGWEPNPWSLFLQLQTSYLYDANARHD